MNARNSSQRLSVIESLNTPRDERNFQRGAGGLPIVSARLPSYQGLVCSDFITIVETLYKQNNSCDPSIAATTVLQAVQSATRLAYRIRYALHIAVSQR
jgi:hypothetical protein